MKFQGVIQLHGKTATGIEVPPEVVASLGAGKKPPVKVTINEYTYPSSIAVMGGKYLVSLSAENRASANVQAGDEVEINLELDTKPREVNIPPDLAHMLDQEPEAKEFFAGLSYSNKLRHVLSMEQAKTAETRQRRLQLVMQQLQNRQK